MQHSLADFEESICKCWLFLHPSNCLYNCLQVTVSVLIYHSLYSNLGNSISYTILLNINEMSMSESQTYDLVSTMYEQMQYPIFHSTCQENQNLTSKIPWLEP